ncbi:MAG: PA domain-containing protein [Nannocystaceae bacterium]
MLLGLFASAACGREPAVPAPAAAAAPAPAAAATAAEPSLAPTTASIRALVQTLSSDEMQGRGPGRPGPRARSRPSSRRCRRWACSPRGTTVAGRSACPLRAVTTDPARVELALLAGGERARPWASARTSSAPACARPGPTASSPLWFVGHGITAPEQGWDDYAGVDVGGAIVVVLVGDPPLSDGRFAGDTLTYYGRWSYKVERAIAAGARGVLLVHETEAASYGWNVVRNSWSRSAST